jgi:hypothetical protein
MQLEPTTYHSIAGQINQTNQPTHQPNTSTNISTNTSTKHINQTHQPNTSTKHINQLPTISNNITQH